MKDVSACDVAVVLLLGAVFSTLVVVQDWWKHLTLSSPSAAQQELVAPRSSS